jgi:exopolyphosphatase/guanosine-5'-triphosphate,3'-diphosphate pyrophosphatase
MRLAAIDLGTVTARLLIADVRPEGIFELQRQTRITHLGENLSETGMIGSAAIERERVACRQFLSTISAVGAGDGRPVERVIAVATSAMRDAANSAEVCEVLRGEGLDVTVIAGRREAELSFLGTLSGFAGGSPLGGESCELPDVAPCDAGLPDGGAVLVVDVGGGSTEVVLGRCPRRFYPDLKSAVVDGERAAVSADNAGVAYERPLPEILRERSFNIGSRRVTDRFLASDPPSRGELEAARDWIEKEMRAWFASLELRPERMFAVAGTATTAVTVRDAMAEYEPEKVHTACVSKGELSEVLEGLARKRLAERRCCVGLEPERAPVIVGGLLTLQVALSLAGLAGFTVSETDILHGILLDAATGLSQAG